MNKDNMFDLSTLPSWTNKAVLVYGARKSGTTMLANLLDGGDKLLVYPSEMKLKLLLGHLWKDAEEAVTLYQAESTRDLMPITMQKYFRIYQGQNSKVLAIY
jgi:hypothetical protein